MTRFIFTVALALAFANCTSAANLPHVNESVAAGTSVKRGEKAIPLFKGEPQNLIKEGSAMPKIALADAKMEDFTFSGDGKVRIINVVPSLDTKVCDVQTHELGEARNIFPTVERVVISRDLPAAQQRFASEAGLTNIKYFSDYKSGEFGKATGLLMTKSELLARAVIVVDGDGIVRHIQIVPDIATLPNIAKAIDVANGIAAK